MSDLASFEPDPEWHSPEPDFGPGYTPSRRQGVSMSCGCNPSYGDSCRRCDGTAEDDRAQASADRDAEKTRARRMSNPSHRAAWLASLPPLTRALVEGRTTCAEEAS